MAKELIFIGAGHAHLTAITNLSRLLGRGGHVTVISPGEYQYYSGMGPGMFSGIYGPQEVRFNVKRLTESRGGKFLDDFVVSVDADKRQLTLNSGNTVNYDVACFGIGSEIDTGPVDASYENVYKAKPVEQLFKARCKIIDTLKETGKELKIAIVGGGATGVELSCNGWRIGQDLNKKLQITLITQGKILNRFSPGVRKKALKKMNKLGINVKEDLPVKSNTGKKLVLEDGSEVEFDFAFVTTGTRPPGLFTKSGLPTGEGGGLLVNKYLQSVRYPEIFGGGDCISFEPRTLDRVGVYAVRQNPILLDNLEAALASEPLTDFEPQATYLLILNMGDGTGIFNRKWLTFSGKFAFNLKNKIDKKFMDEFQVSGEPDDRVECYY